MLQALVVEVFHLACNLFVYLAVADFQLRLLGYFCMLDLVVWLLLGLLLDAHLR